MELGLEVCGHVQIWISFPLTLDISATITLTHFLITLKESPYQF